ncbi:hypothetical protein ACW6QP_04205 [Salegentibacter sp. HM20]
MKRKLLLFALLLPIAFMARSQDTINEPYLSIPYWMAKQIALDLEDRARLMALENISAMEISTLRALITNLESSNAKQTLQISLLQENNLILTRQFQSCKSSKPGNNTFLWLLRLMGAVGVGVVLGRI